MKFCVAVWPHTERADWIYTTKILCIHISSLLPPTSTELDVPHSVQVAAILGTGLVYQKTAHRHVAEVLLGEIGEMTM